MCKTLIADPLSPFFDRFHCLFLEFSPYRTRLLKIKKIHRVFLHFVATLLRVNRGISRVGVVKPHL